MPRDPIAKRVSSYPENARVPFADYLAGGWSLGIQCWSCKRVTYFDAQTLVDRFGPDGSAGRIDHRLRCGCGAGLPAMRAVTRG
ncbi:MAG: hypothetical protein P4L73_19770 [Caulobacteraceae bacterium]|nr:hypothetical protein [Caulobacteraceae bacterium]